MNAASYDDLLAGSLSYKFRVLGEERPRFEKMATGQNPKVTFLTCSDSRIDPCAMTDTREGDLFVIRNAGNIVPDSDGPPNGDLATLEYAVRVLKTEHIVVCGHSDCGAMKGLLNPESCEHLSHVPSWLNQAKQALIAVEEENPRKRLEQAIQANVQLQLEKLRKLDFVREAEEAERLQLHGWFYDIGMADVRILTAKPESEIQQQAA